MLNNTDNLNALKLVLSISELEKLKKSCNENNELRLIIENLNRKLYENMLHNP